MNKIFNVLVLFLLSVTFVFAQGPIPNDWYYGNPGEGYNGISMNKAYAEFLKGKPTTPVVVAIIDSGIDIHHEDLKDNIWVNHDEIPGNGIDDDKNGYIDDVYGWNFIGGPNGKNVNEDTYEATRVYGALKYKYENADPSKISKKLKDEYQTFIKAKETVEAERAKAQNKLDNLDNIEKRVLNAFQALSMALGDKALTISNLDSLDTGDNQELTLGKTLALSYFNSGEEADNLDELSDRFKNDLNEDRKRYQNQLDYAYNVDFDPRKTIVMDNYNDPTERYYGNNDVKGPDPLHGTHVAGIVGAVRENGIGMDGIAQNVQLMSVRTVPDGDERDKDVANAIRYAVDNGASVINMSFGKGFGTNKDLVDKAVQYAASKDVLLVHAAGNSAQNNDVTDNFPNSVYAKRKNCIFFKKTKVAKNWIEVGALSYNTEDRAAAPFSNYGKQRVDLFAPGMAIFSTMPENDYAQLQGTSMASPVVAGVAATIRSVYPALTAEQVKEAILKSVTPLTQEVLVPGSKTDKVKFSELSVTGGTVNLYNALKYASTMKGKKKIKKKGA